MRAQKVAYYRVTTNSSGKKVRMAVSDSGRIVNVSPVGGKVARTRTGKRLAARRRRIAR